MMCDGYQSKLMKKVLADPAARSQLYKAMGRLSARPGHDVVTVEGKDFRVVFGMRHSSAKEAE